MTDIKAILDERAKTHGEFKHSAGISQALKGVARSEINWKGNVPSDAQMEAIEMIFHKIARILSGDPNHKDHWLDIAGYAQLAADRCYTSSR